MLAKEPIQQVINRLRRQGTDDSDYEAKSCIDKLSSKSVWESVSAFANTSGGTLLLGLDEHAGFQIPQQFNIDAVRDQFVEGIGDGGVQGARLAHPPKCEMRRELFEGSQLLVIRISENQPDLKPCYICAKGVSAGSYKRVDDKDILLSATEIYEMQNILRPSTVDREIVAETDVSDLDQNITAQLITAHRTSKVLRGVDSEAEQLRRLNITDKSGGIRMAGLLVAGQYPQQFFPRLFIDVTAHPGNRKAEPGQPRFIDRAECDGPMTQMIDDAVNAVARNLRIASYIEGTGRREELEFPRSVLREAIANAVIHREYHPAFQGQSVSIDIYPNRIEISNPGGLWGGKTLENLTDGDSKCRNATLIQLMRSSSIDDGNPATVEGQGSGIDFMIRQMQVRHLPAPSFEASADKFTVKLWRNATEQQKALIARPHDEAERILRNDESIIEAAFRTYINQCRTQNPKMTTDEQILRIAASDRTFTTLEMANATGKSKETIRLALQRLEKSGTIKAIGKPRSRNRRYLKVVSS